MATNAEILVKLDAMHSDIQQIQKDEAARAEREKVVTELVKKHEEALYGNGKQGLISVVTNMQSTMASWAVKANIVAGLVGAQLIATVWGFVTHTLPGWNP